MWGFGGFHHKRGLRGLVIFLLSRAPRNGAELIDDVEHQTRGHWRPSPGSIYPLLDELNGAGVIHKRADGRYEVTARTQDEFSHMWWGMGGARTPEQMLTELSGYVSYLEDVVASDARGDWKRHRDAIKALATRLSQVAG